MTKPSGIVLMEKRNFTRVALSECASVKHDDQVFFCDIENVSLQGLFVKTYQEIPLHTAVEITVYHPPASSFRLQAKVVRCEDSGVGLQVKGIDVNSFVRLRDVIEMGCNDHERIMNETYRMAGCII